jgi:hypothetical protein
MENEKTELTGKDGWAHLKNVVLPEWQHVGWVRQRINTTAERAGYDPKVLPTKLDRLYEFFGVDRDGSAEELTGAADLFFARYAADRGRNGAVGVPADGTTIATPDLAGVDPLDDGSDDGKCETVRTDVTIREIQAVNATPAVSTIKNHMSKRRIEQNSSNPPPVAISSSVGTPSLFNYGQLRAWLLTEWPDLSLPDSPEEFWQEHAKFLARDSV